MAFFSDGSGNIFDSGLSTTYSTTTAGTSTVTYWGTGVDVDTNGFMRVSGNTWISGDVGWKQKRRSFLGRKDSQGDNQIELRGFFKVIKKGLSKQRAAKFRRLAEEAFEQAAKYEKAGQKKISKDFEKIFTRNLKIAAIHTAGYETMVHQKQVDKYMSKLSKNKRLVVDDIEEYDKPIPPPILKKLQAAKDWKVFDSFCVFWIEEVKDPILFGQIDDEPNFYYFIGEWDDDISVEDLLKQKVN